MWSWGEVGVTRPGRGAEGTRDMFSPRALGGHTAQLTLRTVRTGGDVSVVSSSQGCGNWPRWPQVTETPRDRRTEPWSQRAEVCTAQGPGPSTAGWRQHLRKQLGQQGLDIPQGGRAWAPGRQVSGEHFCKQLEANFNVWVTCARCGAGWVAATLASGALGGHVTRGRARGIYDSLDHGKVWMFV